MGAGGLVTGMMWVGAVPVGDDTGRAVVYARVSWRGRRAVLDPQVARFTGWATANGHHVGDVVREVGPGVEREAAPSCGAILSDLPATVVVVEHRNCWPGFGVEHLEAALAARGGGIMVADSGETTDDLVGDMTEVLTSMCARLYGRRGARLRAMRAVIAIRQRPDTDG